MVALVDHVDFQTILETGGVSEPSLATQLFLVDDDQIPADARFRYVTRTSWDADLIAATVPYAYANVFFGQTAPKPDLLMLGRWIGAASNPMFVCGPNYKKDFGVWKAETAGSFKVIDNTTPTPLEDDITAVTFAGITALDQVPAVLTAAIVAQGTNVVGLSTSAFEFDSLGRLVLRMSTSGAAAKSISIVPAASGSDISAPLMDAPNGTIVAGFDAESLEAAAQAISAIDDSYYNIHQRGGSSAQEEALAAWVETKEKLCDLTLFDPLVKNAADTANVAYLLKTAGLRRTLTIYTEHTDEYPDAAAAGRFLPQDAGTAQLEWQQLALVSDSGLLVPLTATERLAVIGNNCNQTENISGVVMLYDGQTCAGDEKRIMAGRDWFVFGNRVDIFNSGINAKLKAFDNDTFADLEKSIRARGDEAIARNILDDTPERPFTVSFPDADDIPQVDRDTHKLTQFEIFHGYIKSAITDYELTGTWSR